MFVSYHAPHANNVYLDEWWSYAIAKTKDLNDSLKCHCIVFGDANARLPAPDYVHVGSAIAGIQSPTSHVLGTFLSSNSLYVPPSFPSHSLSGDIVGPYYWDQASPPLYGLII